MSDETAGNLEIEVKFVVQDLETVRDRLREAGAEIARQRLFEHNVVFDTEDESLRAADQLLRLRQDDRVRLTFKGEAEGAASSEAKVREELEIEVDDFETTGNILERLGFVPSRIYEKYRQTFHLGGVEVVLDEVPFGEIVELEGEEEAIRAAAAQLGLAWSERITDDYLTLMARLKELHDLPFDDLTFNQFEGLDVSVGDLFSTAATDS